jgi:hypothetical protein
MHAVILVGFLRQSVNGNDQTIQTRLHNFVRLFRGDEMRIGRRRGIDFMPFGTSNQVQKLRMQKGFSLKIIVDVEHRFPNLIEHVVVQGEVQFSGRSGELLQATRTFRTAQITCRRRFNAQADGHSRVNRTLEKPRQPIASFQRDRVPNSSKSEVFDNIDMIRAFSDGLKVRRIEEKYMLRVVSTVRVRKRAPMLRNKCYTMGKLVRVSNHTGFDTIVFHFTFEL